MWNKRCLRSHRPSSTWYVVSWCMYTLARAENTVACNPRPLDNVYRLATSLWHRSCSLWGALCEGSSVAPKVPTALLCAHSAYVRRNKKITYQPKTTACASTLGRSCGSRSRFPPRDWHGAQSTGLRSRHRPCPGHPCSHYLAHPPHP